MLPEYIANCDTINHLKNFQWNCTKLLVLNIIYLLYYQHLKLSLFLCVTWCETVQLYFRVYVCFHLCTTPVMRPVGCRVFKNKNKTKSISKKFQRGLRHNRRGYLKTKLRTRTGVWRWRDLKIQAAPKWEFGWRNDVIGNPAARVLSIIPSAAKRLPDGYKKWHNRAPKFPNAREKREQNLAGTRGVPNNRLRAVRMKYTAVWAAVDETERNNGRSH